MTTKNSLGYLKKRILDVLGEYYTAENAVFVTDGNRDIIEKRMPDVISSSLVRLYESVSAAGDKKGVFEIVDMSGKRILAEQDENGFSFDTEASAVVVSFMYFGSGKVTLEDENGTYIDETPCHCGTGLTFGMSEFVPEREGRCRIVFSPQLRVKNVAIYSKDDAVPAGAYAPCGYVSMPLPEDFSRFNSLEIGAANIDLSDVCVKDGFAYVNRLNAASSDVAHVNYKKHPPFIDDFTDDGFAFELPTVAFEALVCLSASELCREEDANVYTRLLYKYNDLYEGLCGMALSECGRNRFYKNAGRRRW